MSDKHGAGFSPAGPIGLRELLDATPDLVFCCNADGRFEWVSARAESLTGHKPNELLGKLHTTVLPQSEWASFARFFLRQMRRRIPVTEREFTLITKDKREVAGSVRVRLLERMDGEMAFVGTARESRGSWGADQGRRSAFMPPGGVATNGPEMAEAASMRRELEAMRERLRAAEQARDQAKAGTGPNEGELKAARAEIETLKRNVNTLESARTEAEKRAAAAEKAWAEADRSRMDADRNRDDARDKTDKVARDTIDGLRKELEDLRGKVAKADEVRIAAEKAKTAAEAEVSRVRSEAKIEADRLRADLNKARGDSQAETNKLRDDALAEASKVREAMTRDLAKARDEAAAELAKVRDAATAELAKARDAAAAELARAREEARVEANTLRETGAIEVTRAREQAAAEHNRLWSEVQGAQNERDAARAETQRARAELSKLPSRSDLEQLERQVSELASQLDEARSTAQLKGEFLSSMSHEIRQPMNGVMGMTHLLLETELDGEQRSMVEVVQNSSRTLLNLINDTIDFSRLESGKIEFEVIDFDLRVTIEEVIAVLAPQADERGLRLTSRIGHEVPSRIKGDPGRLRQVLLTLANSAIKYTPQGELSFRIDRMAEEEEAVQIRFAVHDSGLTLGQEQIDRLFEAFTQHDPSAAQRFGSTGLGLAIARQLVTSLGGSVGMDSKPGKGASFWFTLRFAKQNTNSTAHEVPDVQLRGLPVLVVDPSRVARESLVEMLGAWGCRSDQAETGEEALQLMHTAAERGEPYRVAIVDMQLPGMDGEQLGSAIRSESAFESTLLMLLTSVGRRGDAVRVQALGFSAYLLKPVQWSELYDAMAEVVARGPVPVGVPVSLVTRHSLAEARRGRLRILLVEDNEVNRLVADWALRRLGYTLDVATSAGQALQMCEKQSFDLIFMDFQMPDMDGLKAASAIRARERNGKRTPIVMMAGSPVPGDRDRAMAAGMDEFLQKPIDLGLLSQAVQRFTTSRPGLSQTAEPLDTDEARPEMPAAQPPRSHGFGEVEITGSDASVGRIGDGLGEPIPALDGEPRPIIDTARLEESCMGIPALRDALLQTFINDIGSRMTRLTEAVVSHDARRIEFEAHNLKGMSATIGAGGCAEVFAEIERLAKDEQVVDVHPLMNRANQEVERAEGYIRRLENILSRAA